MSRYPTSQTRAVIDEKRSIARRLLAQGLTVTQVAGQLNCSKQFIRKVSADLEADRP